MVDEVRRDHTRHSLCAPTTHDHSLLTQRALTTLAALAGEITRVLETRPPAAELLRILRTPPDLDAPPA